MLANLKDKKRYEYELSLLRFGEVMNKKGFLFFTKIHAQVI